MAYTLAEIPNVVVGQYISGEKSFKITTPADAASEPITLPGVHTITGIKAFSALDSGNNYASDGADLTWTGNVLTIADGTGFDYSAMTTIWVTVFCTRPV